MAHRGVAVARQDSSGGSQFSRPRCKARRSGTEIARDGDMHALDFEGERETTDHEGLDELLAACDRPTIPVPAPRESGVRLKVSRVAYAAATVDVVLCDLTRDPRSESFVETAPHRSGFDQLLGPPARCGVVVDLVQIVRLTRHELPEVAQNERPPSTSIVRALK